MSDETTQIINRIELMTNEVVPVVLVIVGVAVSVAVIFAVARALKTSVGKI